MVVGAVDRLARKGRRNAGGRAGLWGEDCMIARRRVGASIVAMVVMIVMGMGMGMGW